MKIAQVNLQRDWGGAERHVLLLAEGLQKAGHEVTVLCHPDGGLRRAAEAAALDTIPLRVANQMDPSAPFRLARLLRTVRPDALHLHTPKEYLCGVMASRLAQVPVTVLTRHMLLPLKPLMRTIYRKASAVICLNQAVRRNLLQQGIPAANLALIYGAIDTSEFAEAARLPDQRKSCRAEWNAADEEILIGSIGRLAPGKGHAEFLEAAARFSYNSTPVRFLVIGDGPEREALHALAAQLRIEDRVVFTGLRSDMPRVVSALDIVTLASTVAELFPLSLMEAMAAGRPVVATRVGGVPELVEDEVTGLLVPPDDPQALASRWSTLAASPELRATMGRAGANRVESCFALPRMVAETVQLYERFIPGAFADNGRRDASLL